MAIKRFLKTAGVFFVGSSLTKILSFLMLPLYTSQLTPSEFGYFDLIISLLNLLIPILFFQVWDGVYRFTFDHTKLKDKYKIISNGMFVFLTGIVFYTVVFVSLYMVYSFEYKEYVYLYGLFMAIQFFYSYSARSFLLNTLFMMSGLVNSLVNLSLNFCLIVFWNFGIEALFISYIVGTFAQIIILEFELNIFKNIKLKIFNKELITSILKFSLPIIGVTISYWLLNGFTKVIISKYLGVYENGIFAVSNRLTTIIVLLLNVFQYAWYELIYSQVDSGHHNKYDLAMQYVLRMLIFIPAIALLSLKLFIPILIAEQYSYVMVIFPVVLLGIVFSSYTSIVSTLFLAEKKSSALLFPIIIGALFNVIGSLLIIEKYQLLGAVVMLLIAYLITALLITIKIKKMIKIKLPLHLMALGILVYLFGWGIYTIQSNALTLISILVLFGLLFYTFKSILLEIIKIISSKAKKREG